VLPLFVVANGKELRLKQQYFFVSATIQDIIRRFLKKDREWEDFPEKNAIQVRTPNLLMRCMVLGSFETPISPSALHSVMCTAERHPS
jgi:hypothetical protein